MAMSVNCTELREAFSEADYQLGEVMRLLLERSDQHPDRRLVAHVEDAAAGIRIAAEALGEFVAGDADGLDDVEHGAEVALAEVKALRLEMAAAGRKEPRDEG